MQWLHSSVKNRLFCKKIFKSKIWNTQAASYDFLGMCPGHETAEFYEDRLKHITSST